MNLYDRDTEEIKAGHGAKLWEGDERRTYKLETKLQVEDLAGRGPFTPTEAAVCIYRSVTGLIASYSSVDLRRFEGDKLAAMQTYYLRELDDAPLAVRQVWDYDQSLRAHPLELPGDAA